METQKNKDNKDKDTRATSFTHFSDVYIGDFEQINAGCLAIILLKYL